MAAFLYLFPCAYEDLVKLGISTDPLGRIRNFSPRYFEFFDLDRAVLVETDDRREAQAWETALKRELRLLNAPAPLLVPGHAAGHTEWFRGGYGDILTRMQWLGQQGHVLHSPARTWLRSALARESDRLHDWACAMWQGIQDSDGEVRAGLERTLRDACDAQRAMELPLSEHLPEDVWRWYRPY